MIKKDMNKLLNIGEAKDKISNELKEELKKFI